MVMGNTDGGALDSKLAAMGWWGPGAAIDRRRSRQAGAGRDIYRSNNANPSQRPSAWWPASTA